MRRLSITLFLLMSGFASTMLASPGPQQLQLQTLALPDARGRYPNVVTDMAGTERLHLSWVTTRGRTDSLWVATREGMTWSRPRVMAAGDNWLLTPVDYPKLHVGDGLWAHWLERLPNGGYGVRVRAPRPGDSGVYLHDDRSPSEHGFVSSVPAGRSQYFFWLDGRDFDTRGVTELRARQVAEDGVAQSEVLLDPRVCDCCMTSAVAAGNVVLVAYRGRDAANTREIRVARAVAGKWQASRTISNDGWVLRGCPMSGPALAQDGRFVALVWKTAPHDTPMVRIAVSSNAGAAFSPTRTFEVERSVRQLRTSVVADNILLAWATETGLQLKLLSRELEILAETRLRVIGKEPLFFSTAGYQTGHIVVWNRRDGPLRATVVRLSGP